MSWICLIIKVQVIRNCRVGVVLGFVKAHHKITRRRKGGHGPGLGELLKIWRFPFNIYTVAEARDFKFGTQLGFSNTQHKTALRGKLGVPLSFGSFHIFWVPL